MCALRACVRACVCVCVCVCMPVQLHPYACPPQTQKCRGQSISPDAHVQGQVDGSPGAPLADSSAFQSPWESPRGFYAAGGGGGRLLSHWVPKLALQNLLEEKMGLGLDFSCRNRTSSLFLILFLCVCVLHVHVCI